MSLSAHVINVGGRSVRLTNLNKQLYPSGFTKAEVVEFMARISRVAIPHLSDRCLTFRRFPDGTDQPGFFEKRCNRYRPGWVPVTLGPGDRRGKIEYCRIEEPAAMVWAANLAAIEIHGPMAAAHDQSTPRAVIFDFDPGPKTSVVECCRLALDAVTVLEAAGLRGWCKTSGSKGLQMYVPLNTPGVTHQLAADFALAVGQVLERQRPGQVTNVMAKIERPGKVFVDWSQNAHHKTTISPYSLRARPSPTVSTPVTWDEVQRCADGDDPLVFEAADVLVRVEEQGDLFADVLNVEQELPRRT